MWQGILLGLVQGLTEFLPVSSSAHLVAAKHLLNVQQPGVALEVALHAGTLGAILAVLWRDVLALVTDALRGGLLLLRGAGAEAIEERAPLFGTAAAVVVGTIPAAVIGVLAGDAIGGLFDNLAAAGAFLCCTGAILLASRTIRPGTRERVTIGRGLAVGAAQAMALLPGLSRSGITIVAGRAAGLDRRLAGRFSFLLAVPALTGAAVWEVLRSLGTQSPAAGPPVTAGALAAGVLVSGLTGGLALIVLLRMIERGRLHWFAAYCLPAGLAMLLAGLSG
ncbi:MAG: undecaprenyl-diphosphate phosphatase [Candidatus Brocadiaceae bacterium]|nr:undecaprenyl-diphosphate phosphatase [Candidatus Brocadiaceae bacterium]